LTSFHRLALDRVDSRVVEVLAVVEDAPADLRARDEVVHPVQTAQDRRLPAAGRPDQRRDEALVDVHRHVADRRGTPVRDVQSLQLEDRLAACRLEFVLLRERGEPLGGVALLGGHGVGDRSL
jgi:hypothetical protein